VPSRLWHRGPNTSGSDDVPKALCSQAELAAAFAALPAIARDDVIPPVPTAGHRLTCARVFAPRAAVPQVCGWFLGFRSILWDPHFVCVQRPAFLRGEVFRAARLGLTAPAAIELADGRVLVCGFDLTPHLNGSGDQVRAQMCFS